MSSTDTNTEHKPLDLSEEKPIPLWLALLPIIILMTLLAGAVKLFGDGATSGPNQITLMTTAAIAALIGIWRGISWSELEQSFVNGISLALKAVLILLTVGALIGSWMLAGTAPVMIYFGLGILDPSWFYPASLIICALVAISIGSSWTTAGTIGVALIAIAQLFELSLPVTAGAIISGAYFGDKMSPLSDTTNLAPAMVGVDLFVHIRHMMWTTVPSFILALILFSIIGFNSANEAISVEQVTATRDLLSSYYRLGWPTVLPLILLLGLAWRKVPALPTITAGALAGILVAVFYQSGTVVQFADPEGGLAAGGALAKGAWMALASGFVASTGDEALDSLLSRGGMASMLNTIWLVMSAMCFGGVMERTGLLQRLVGSLMLAVKGTGSLIITTVLTTIGMNIVASDQYISIVLPGRMFRMEFKRRGLAPQNLSRTLEDAGTMTSPLVPWNTCGAFMAGTLGVATLAYLPFTFLCLFNPVIAIFYGLTGFTIVRLEEETVPAGAEEGWQNP
jgi:NhaC family Na+:H+ antiporter